MTKAAYFWNTANKSELMNIFSKAFGEAFVDDAPVLAWSRKWVELNKYEKATFTELFNK